MIARVAGSAPGQRGSRASRILPVSCWRACWSCRSRQASPQEGEQIVAGDETEEAAVVDNDRHVVLVEYREQVGEARARVQGLESLGHRGGDLVAKAVRLLV